MQGHSNRFEFKFESVAEETKYANSHVNWGNFLLKTDAETHVTDLTCAPTMCVLRKFRREL